MNKYTEIIDRYLSGEMSPAEKADFEKQLASNSELKSEFLSQRQIIEGIERVALKSEIKQGFKRGSFKNKAGKWILGFVIVALAVSTVFVIKTSTNEQDHKKLYKTPHAMASSDKEEKLRYELTEENNSNWVEADKQLLSQFFKISGKRDTVIETKAGIILAIPASSFYKNTGEEVAENIELEIKEAMNPLDIMKAGLSTTSNGELLRTGGMFYLNARQNGENLK
ncbi:MAG: hypothetical protein JNL60_01440, partial [Bacteroidia bacterium]|nr:hypothetical protein [Bacteroidia bacterium]